MKITLDIWRLHWNICSFNALLFSSDLKQRNLFLDLDLVIISLLSSFVIKGAWFALIYFFLGGAFCEDSWRLSLNLTSKSVHGHEKIANFAMKIYKLLNLILQQCLENSFFPSLTLSTLKKKKELRKIAVAHALMQFCKNEGYLVSDVWNDLEYTYDKRFSICFEKTLFF